MPELPEIEIVCRGLQTILTGRRATRVQTWDSQVWETPRKMAEKILPGRQITTVLRKGKYGLIRFQGEITLLFHLGMSGRIHCGTPEKKSDRHRYLRIFTDEAVAEFRDPRRFGCLRLIETTAEAQDSRLTRLGPDALDITLKALTRALNSGRAVKAVLLDQHALAGMGNIYCDEALFASGISPLKPADCLNTRQRSQLHRNMQRILHAAIRAGGSSIKNYTDIKGDIGYFQTQHLIYGRHGQPCEKCACIISKTIVAGRTTSYCPECQG